jgi:mannose-6-phosphate isomerase-like protein (cupin superfamily)
MEPLILHRDEMPGGAHSVMFEGADAGGVPLAFFWLRTPPGEGPGLHRHRYAEVFVVDGGRVRFTVDGGEYEAGPGHVIVVPPGAAHAFVNCGDERLRMLGIHANERFETEWLE